MKGMTLLILILIFTACSTAKVDILPGANGVNTAIIKDIDKDDAESEGIKAAKKYCSDQKKQAIFINQYTRYTGDMPESTRNNVRKASQAAILVGGGLGTTQDDASTGAAVGTAGAVGYYMASGRDYRHEINFRCE